MKAFTKNFVLFVLTISNATIGFAEGGFTKEPTGRATLTTPKNYSSALWNTETSGAAQKIAYSKFDLEPFIGSILYGEKFCKCNFTISQTRNLNALLNSCSIAPTFKVREVFDSRRISMSQLLDGSIYDFQRKNDLKFQITGLGLADRFQSYTEAKFIDAPMSLLFCFSTKL